MEYQLVPMDRSHLSGVAELERLCFSTPWNETMLEEELFNPTASFICLLYTSDAADDRIV